MGVKLQKMGAEKIQARNRIKAIVDSGGFVSFFPPNSPNSIHRAGASANPNLLDSKADEKLRAHKLENFVCETALIVKEAKKLVEAGFEYICEIKGEQLFRKYR